MKRRGKGEARGVRVGLFSLQGEVLREYELTWQLQLPPHDMTGDCVLKENTCSPAYVVADYDLRRKKKKNFW